MPVRIAVVGSGAVGGYFGARLSRAGHDVTFMARGAHLRAIRERGLLVWSPLGDQLVRREGRGATARRWDRWTSCCSPSRATTLTARSRCSGRSSAPRPSSSRFRTGSTVRVRSRPRSANGPSWAAPPTSPTALTLPGLIEQTGTVRRIVFGEVFGPSRAASRPASNACATRWRRRHPGRGGRRRLGAALEEVHLPRADRGAHRRRAPPDRPASRGCPDVPRGLPRRAAEVERVARAEGADPGPGSRSDAALDYIGTMAPGVRSSLLIDLQQGKRIEVESLLGALVRRGRAAGVPTPVFDRALRAR